MTVTNASAQAALIIMESVADNARKQGFPDVGAVADEAAQTIRDLIAERDRLRAALAGVTVE